MSAQAIPLFQPVPAEDLPAPVETAEEVETVAEAELPAEPVATRSDNDNPVPPDALISEENADGEPEEPPAAASIGARGFGPGAIFVSALAGAATALAAVLTFGISHGRWERAVDIQAYAEVIEPRTAEPPSPEIKFAEAAIVREPVGAEIPGVVSTRPVNFSLTSGDLEEASESAIEGKDDRTDFSSVNLGAPFGSGEASVEGTFVASASPILSDLHTPALDIPPEKEPAAQTTSFDSYQVAGVFEASNSPTAGAVLSDASGVIDTSPGSGKVVVDRISNSLGDKAADAEAAILSIPAGAKKVDAVLHVVTADGRLAYISKLSVVLGDKTQAAPERQARKSAQRKTSAPAVKAAEPSKSALANRKTVYKPQMLPLPPPAAPPRGLFNFGSVFGLTKEGSADGYKSGAAG